MIQPGMVLDDPRAPRRGDSEWDDEHRRHDRHDQNSGGEPETDDEEDHVYAHYTRKFVEDQQSEREPLHRTWTQNILFLLGQQWLRFDPITGSFSLPRFPAWKERPVTNMLRPFMKHFISKVTKERPIGSAVPASTDPEDVHSAQLGDDVLKAKWQELRMSRMLRRALAWVVPTGNVGILPYWNEDTGRIVPLTAPVEALKFNAATGQPEVDPETGAPMMEMIECPCDEHGEPILDEDGAYDLEAEPAYVDEGEVGYRVISPFYLYVNADAESEDDVTELVIIEPMSIDSFYRKYPDGPDVVADDDGEVERYESMLGALSQGISGADTHFVGTQDSDGDPKVRVYHYYRRPSVRFPQGRHWIVAGDSLVLEPTGLPDGLWPQVVILGDIDVQGQFWRAATMTDAVGLQKEYNESCAFIKEHHNLLLRGKWLVPIGSNIRRGQITSEPGEVIQHTPGLLPRMADLKPLPDEVYGERDRIKQDFQLVTGLFKISMGGDPPPGVTSGRAFLTMQEADDSDLGPFLHMLEDAVAELCMCTLRIIQQRYDEERLIRVSGENRRYRVRSFKGSDLAGVSDVEPQRGSAFPWSQVAKQDMLMQVAREVPQLFADPDTGQFDADRFRQLLPVGGIGTLTPSSDEDVSQALREEEIYETWDPASVPPGEDPGLPMPMPWHNDAVHLRQHTRVLNSAAFERWPPENKVAFIAHWEATQAKIQEMQMQAMMQQAAVEQAGAPPTNGGPPPA